MKRTDIIVGIDGSGTSTNALRWAAAEARLRAARLRILTAYSSTWPPEAFGGLAELPEYVGQRFHEAVTKAVNEARFLEPGIDVTGEAIPGEPASTLMEAGRSAAMVVVGNRGLGGLASLVLGSVSQHVAAHAVGPVVVVRGRADTTSGPTVVGVDDSLSAHCALELGFEEAQRRDCGLVAVTSYPVQTSSHVADMPALFHHQDSVRRKAADGLDAAMRPWREKYPTVAVTALAEPGNPAQNLVNMSSDAALVIVGSRGHGALVGAIFGSVGLHLLHHAGCPVMIVHSGQTT